MRWWRLCISILCFGGALGAGVFFFFMQYQWVDFSSLERAHKTTPTVVLDAQGNELMRFEQDKRRFVSYQHISPLIVNAFVAAEDHRFFSHGGVSYKGVVRSVITNLYHRRVVQGASTITQQVVKLLFLNYDRILIRKIKELFLALQLERYYTKERIMELYLNNIYFGRGIYGVEAACQRFWGVSCNQVTPDQAATLAAVAKSACLYSPLNAPLSSQRRRNVVLRSMRNLGFISREEYVCACAQELNLAKVIPGNPIWLYVQEWIRHWIEQQWGRDALYVQGLTVKTTIDPVVQKRAQDEFARVIAKLRSSGFDGINGGALTLDVATGQIRAVIGGADFHQSQFNRAFQAVRQMGSSFKPIVYAAALKQGLSMDMLEVDEPLSLDLASGETWTPKNWDSTFNGPMTLLKALTTSNNIITIKTLLRIGVDPVIRLARGFGIYRHVKPYPSLALGTPEATVEEVAAAFNVFANNGTYVRPYLVEWVRDSHNKKIWRHRPVKRGVLDSIVNSCMVDALCTRMRRLKKLSAHYRRLSCEAIGKTGSTNGSVTTWFVGSTPKLTTAVYVGHDDGRGMGAHVFASQTSFPFWFNVHVALSNTEKEFYLDHRLKPVTMNWTTGQRSSDVNSPDVVTIRQ